MQLLLAGVVSPQPEPVPTNLPYRYVHCSDIPLPEVRLFAFVALFSREGDGPRHQRRELQGVDLLLLVAIVADTRGLLHSRPPCLPFHSTRRRMGPWEAKTRKPLRIEILLYFPKCCHYKQLFVCLVPRRPLVFPFNWSRNWFTSGPLELVWNARLSAHGFSSPPSPNTL